MPNEITIKTKSIYETVKSFGNTRVLHYKYLPITNSRSSRIKITDKWFGKSVQIPFSYEYSTTFENAIAYLIKNGWSVSGINTDSEIIMIDGWDSTKQLK